MIATIHHIDIPIAVDAVVIVAAKAEYPEANNQNQVIILGITNHIAHKIVTRPVIAVTTRNIFLAVSGFDAHH